eukprot:CAMPEP_0170479604 /NCGR_PEP_ID=MMETSP0208-20121228/775_1 /TAXON_ID=197538 /ORGANISM="Strombidium inclinatum, Strain S3" /LENGTH=42 /DNA_ID= /DNA_START= /DNA_END= /DNA_ORIENTATION=
MILKALKNDEQPPRGNPNDPNNTGERELPGEKPAEIQPQVEE